jgi:hypothetical protein
VARLRAFLAYSNVEHDLPIATRALDFDAGHAVILAAGSRGGRFAAEGSTT